MGKLLFSLAVPTITSQIVNMLYNIVDRIYIGHIPGSGSLALTGVGVCLPIIMVVSAFAALVGSGGAPRASIFMGKDDMDSAEKILSGCFTVQIIISAILTAVLLLFGRSMLLTFGASENTIGYAVDYMSIYAVGTIFVQMTLGMNMFITAQGFSKTSMLTVTIGAVCNIILDLAFVVALKLGVAGVGIATILSQLISAVLVMATLMRSETAIRFVPRQLGFSGKLLKDIVRIGLPAGMQSVLYSISNAILQSTVNSFGTTVIAAYTAYGKIDGFFWMVIGAFGVSITTFVGQNFGAQKFDRMRKSTRVCLCMAFGTTFLIEALFYFGSSFVMQLFSRDPAVIEQGVRIAQHLAPFLCLYVCVEILSGTLRGTGDSIVPMIITCGGICLLRVCWVAFVVPHHHELLTVLDSYPVSWGLASLLFILYYLFGGWLKRRKKAMGFPLEESAKNA